MTNLNLLWSGALLLLVLLVLVVHHFHRRRNDSQSFIRLIEDNLVAGASVILLSGFALYMFGYWYGNNAGNLTVLVPRAVVSAIRMFMVDFDILDVREDLQDSVAYMSCFTLVHFFAVMITVLVILKVLGYKVESYFKMKLGRPSEKTLVFWGVNENSLMLAADIHSREDASIIFVDLPSPDSQGTDLLSNVLNQDGIGKEQIYQMEEMGAFLIKAKCGFDDLDTARRHRSRKRDIYSLMGIKPLCRYVRGAKEVNFYFLSDSEQENVDNLMAIVKFFGPENIDNLPISRIYCHARHNSINDVLGRLSDEIIFVDSSRLSVLQLQKDVKCLPASFVDKDTEAGVVTSAFNALVIGFGETGVDIFKFIYEFSAFIGGDGNPSPRTINVVDVDLSGKKARFLNNAPALKGRNDIVWWDDMSIDSQLFWDKFMEMIESLNYVVITLNDDKRAADLAVKLYENAYRYRSDMNYFRIFVRLKDSQSANMLQLASDYFRTKSNREDRNSNVLVPFGTYESLFNADIFDTEVIDYEAQAFSAEYYMIYREISENLPDFSVPSPVGIARDVKKDSDYQQTVSNVRHILTKRILAGAYDEAGNPDDERLTFLKHVSERKGIRYVNALPDVPEMHSAFTLMENLSLCEHLRWNSRMELMGYVLRPYNPDTEYQERDYDLKNHECIVSCRELNEIPKFHSTKIYDWAVVELSFRH